MEGQKMGKDLMEPSTRGGVWRASSLRRSGMKPCFINLEDERSLISDMGVSPLIARRIVTARPFSDISALLTHVKGLSGEMLVSWESRGISLDFSMSDTNRPLFSLSSSTTRSGRGGSSRHSLRQDLVLGLGSSTQWDAEDSAKEQLLQASIREVNDFVAKLQVTCASLETPGRRGEDSMAIELNEKQLEARLWRLEWRILRQNIRGLILLWRSLAAIHRRLDLVEYRVLVKKLRRDLRDNFCVWVGYMRRLTRSKRFGVRTLSRVLTEARRLAFREWRHVCRERQGIEGMQALTESSSRSRHMSGMMQVWTQSTGESRAFKVAVQRTHSRWNKASCLHCFGRWLVFSSRRKLLKRSGVKTMLRWLTMLVRTALQHWQQAGTLKRRQHNAWQRLCFRASISHLRHVFQEWRSFCSLQPVGSIKASAAQFVGTYVGRILARNLVDIAIWAIRAWKVCARQRAMRRSTLIRRAQMRDVNQCLDILDCWRQFAVWRQRLHDRGIKVLIKNLRGKGRCHLHGWLAAARSSRVLKRSGSKIAGTSGHISLGGSLRAWRGQVVESRPLADNVKGASTSRIQTMTKRKVFLGWRDSHRKDKRTQKIGIRLLLRKMRSMLGEAVHKWMGEAFKSAPVSSVSIGMAGSRSKVLRWRVMMRWRMSLSDVQWKRSVLVRISLKWTLLGVRQVFAALRMNAAYVLRVKFAVTRFMVKLLKVALSNVLKGWVGITISARRLWRAGTKVMAQRIHKEAVACLRAWLDIAKASNGGPDRLPAWSVELPAPSHSEEYALNGSQRRQFHLMAARRVWYVAKEALDAWIDSCGSIFSPSSLQDFVISEQESNLHQPPLYPTPHELAIHVARSIPVFDHSDKFAADELSSKAEQVSSILSQAFKSKGTAPAAAVVMSSSPLFSSAVTARPQHKFATPPPSDWSGDGSLEVLQASSNLTDVSSMSDQHLQLYVEAGSATRSPASQRSPSFLNRPPTPPQRLPSPGAPSSPPRLQGFPPSPPRDQGGLRSPPRPQPGAPFVVSSPPRRSDSPHSEIFM